MYHVVFYAYAQLPGVNWTRMDYRFWSIYNCWDDAGLGQTGSSGLWFIGMNLSSESQSLHYCQGYAFHGMGERIQGVLCWWRLISQKQRCTELPLFLFSLRHMVELAQSVCSIRVGGWVSEGGSEGAKES